MIQRMYLRWLRILFCCLLASSPAIVVHGQEALKAVLDKSEILIGEQATLTIDVRPAGPEQQIAFGPPPETESLEWIGAEETDTVNNADGLRYIRKYRITGFDSGNYLIPAIPIHFYTDTGKRTQLTDSLPLHVRSVAVDTTKAFAAIKTIVPLKFALSDYLFGILIGIGLLLLIIALILYLKRRKRPKPETPRPEKAHEWAERQLKALENKKLWQQGQLKAYYESLSMILKMYIESRFEIPVMEQTTDDLIKTCKKEKRLRTVRKEIRMVLQTADLVKFAKADPGEESHLRCMQAALEIVNKTRFLPDEKGGIDE